MYSQNNEEKIISDYFGGYIGTALSLGENNGEHLSNVHALINKGWAAFLIEPSPDAFSKLWRHYKNNNKVDCLDVAISNYNGVSEFYDSGTHLNKGDKSLLSTLNKKEVEKWESTTDFKPIQVNVLDFDTLMGYSRYDKFDMISIDCEGEDLKILKQINFYKLETKLVVVEWNSKDYEEYRQVMHPFGFKLLDKNAENLIYCL